MTTNFLDNNYIVDALGLESMKATSRMGNTAAQILGNFTSESDRKCYTYIDKYIKPMMESVHADAELKIRDFWTNASMGLEQCAKEFVRNSNKYAVLPADVQKMLNPLAKTKVALENAMAKLGIDAKTTPRYKGLQFQHKQCVSAMESMLFNHLANLQNRRIVGDNKFQTITGLETYSYQNAIFYPKLEALTQWVNTTAAIYPKLTKIKQLLNEISAVPVHTQEIWVVFYDENLNEVNRIKRERLYNQMEPVEAPEAYNTFTRVLKLKKEDFGKELFLRKTILTGESAPFITANEIIRSDMMISDVILEDGTHLGTIFDPKAGLMEGETLNEMDWKGKMVKVVPDKKKPEEYFYISAMFDGSFQSLVFTQSHKTAGLEDIAEVHITCKLHDIFFVQKANTDFQIVERRGFIQAGPMSRLEIPLSQTELDALDQRLQGNFLNKITNLASEYITHHKDLHWYRGYSAMKKRLLAEYEVDPAFQLYGSQHIDMNIPAQVNKVEALNLYLGTAFDVLIEQFNVSANTQTDTQLNLFAHSLHLPVLKPVLQVITGTVDAESNGKFLGVAQDARVHVLTLGTDTSAPVQSIVVGTDKMNFMKKVDKDVPPQDIEIPFEILPTFKESNVETTLFAETPTRVISDNSIRSNTRPFTPAMFMEYSSDFKTLRAAAGDLYIKGFHTRTVM